MRYKNYKNYNKKNTGKKIDKVVASVLVGIAGLAVLGGVGYYGYTQYDKLNNEKQELVVQNNQLNDKVNELTNSEYTINVKETSWICEQYAVEGALISREKPNDPTARIALNPESISSEFINVINNSYVIGDMVYVDNDDFNLGSVTVEKVTYTPAENCEFVTEIYDGTGRLVTLEELNPDYWYNMSYTYHPTFVEGTETYSKLITKINLDEIVGENDHVQLGYVGSWTYTQVGEGDTGLSDGDIFNMTINEDKTVTITLYNAAGGQTDTVDLSQAEVTELENGLKLTFQEDEVHMLTLVDENTLHVSLYDDSIKFDAIRVTE